MSSTGPTRLVVHSTTGSCRWWPAGRSRARTSSRWPRAPRGSRPPCSASDGYRIARTVPSIIRALLPWLLASCVTACVTPRVPVPTRAPAPDRYERAAAPDPAARASAADELTFDPSPRAVEMLLVLHRRDIDPAVRSRAAAAIALRRDPSLDAALRHAAATDPDPAVRDASAAASRQLRPWRKRPGTAAGLALLCPGCGHLYLDDRAGFAYLGTTAALIGSSLALLQGQDVDLGEPSRSVRVPLAIPLLAAAQNLWFYSIFDAYRDARVARGDLGYKHRISRESLGHLTTAPFRPKVLARPWVWGGVPLALGAGLAVSWLASRGEPAEDSPHDLRRPRGQRARAPVLARLRVRRRAGLLRRAVRARRRRRGGAVPRRDPDRARGAVRPVGRARRRLGRSSGPSTC